jgi:hypothetical protein
VYFSAKAAPEKVIAAPIASVASMIFLGMVLSLLAVGRGCVNLRTSDLT